MPRFRPQPELPELFIDRVLGRRLIPEALRQAGFVVHTMASVFGAHAEETVKDEVWLATAGQEGWIVLTKDEAIRRRPTELAAIKQYELRVFCLTNANLTGPQQRDRFLVNRHRIVQQAHHPGPWIYGVYERRIQQIWPRTSIS